MRGAARNLLQSASAEAFLPAQPLEVYSAIRGLAAALWGVEESAVIVGLSPELLVHSVRLDGEVNCWLSWEIAATESGGTRVRLVHDEADPRPAPPPELEQVVASLRARLQGGESV